MIGLLASETLLAVDFDVRPSLDREPPPQPPPAAPQPRSPAAPASNKIFSNNKQKGFNGVI